MKSSLRTFLLIGLIQSILPLCLFTGGVESSFRYLFFPAIALVSLFLPFQALLTAGITFTILFPLLSFRNGPAATDLPVLLTQTCAFFFSTLAAGYCSRQLHRERFRSENAIATFQSLSNDLNHKNMNLQTTLDALSEAHKRLQQFDRDRSIFLSNVSHELLTPLASIKSYSEILMNYGDVDGETRMEFLQTIHGESERLSRFVSDVLNLIRIESGKQEIALGPVRPEELIEEGVKIVRPMASEKNLALVTDIGSALPEVRGDRNQLLQVVVNLLNNAVKFTRQGTITVGASRSGEFVRFFVSDTGEGIFPEEREMIFEPFYRVAELALDRPKGSGLGLSISKSIVEYHGGRIWVESALGEGSTFSFTVPTALRMRTGAEQGRPMEQRQAVPHYRPILVIFRDAVCRRSLRQKLEELGYMTLGADTPERAFDIFAKMQPGLVVTDVPEQWDRFTELVRHARDEGVRVLLASIHVRYGGEPELALHGYISKPFDKYEIVSLLEPHCGRGDTVMILSQDNEESRNLQVLLGVAGFGAVLCGDGKQALRICQGSLPRALLLGAFPNDRLDEIISDFRSDPKTRDLPLYLILGTSLGKYVKTVTLSGSGNHTESGSLYKLIGEVETEYSLSLE